MLLREGPLSEERPESVPRDVVDAAKAAFATRRDGQLAVLVADSLLDGMGSPEDHTLRFELPPLTVDVHVSHRAADSDLIGRVEGLQSKSVVLHIRDTDVRFVSKEEDGSFAFRSVSHGVVRLEIELPAAVSLVWTDWFSM